jgi:hypothetical protein
MNTTMRCAVALLVAGLAARDAAAQWNAERFEGGPARNHLYTTVEIEPTVIRSVGYGRVVSLFGEEWQLGAEFGVVGADLDPRDVRARLHTRTTLVGWRSFRVVGGMGFVTRATENSMTRAVTFGADFGVAPGVYRDRWFLAGEFGLDKAVITHTAYSDRYREEIDPDAKNGWLLHLDGIVRYGVAAGVAIGPAELALRAGWRETEDFNPVTQRTYAGVGLGFRF